MSTLIQFLTTFTERFCHYVVFLVNTKHDYILTLCAAILTMRRIPVSAHIAIYLELNCNLWQLGHMWLDRVRKYKRCSFFCGMENTAHVQCMRYSPKSSHLIHWKRAVFSHITLKWTPLAYFITPSSKPFSDLLCNTSSHSEIYPSN